MYRECGGSAQKAADRAWVDYKFFLFACFIIALGRVSIGFGELYDSDVCASRICMGGVAKDASVIRKLTAKEACWSQEWKMGMYRVCRRNNKHPVYVLKSLMGCVWLTFFFFYRCRCWRYGGVYGCFQDDGFYEDRF